MSSGVHICGVHTVCTPYRGRGGARKHLKQLLSAGASNGRVPGGCQARLLIKQLRRFACLAYCFLIAWRHALHSKLFAALQSAHVHLGPHSMVVHPPTKWSCWGNAQLN